MPRFFLINNIDKKGCTMCSSPLSPSREPPLVRSSHMLTEKLFADAIKPPAPRMGKWDMTPRWWRREEWLTVSNKQSCGSAPPPRPPLPLRGDESLEMWKYMKRNRQNPHVWAAGPPSPPTHPNSVHICQGVRGGGGDKRVGDSRWLPNSGDWNRRKTYVENQAGAIIMI